MNSLDKGVPLPTLVTEDEVFFSLVLQVLLDFCETCTLTGQLKWSLNYMSNDLVLRRLGCDKSGAPITPLRLSSAEDPINRILSSGGPPAWS